MPRQIRLLLALQLGRGAVQLVGRHLQWLPWHNQLRQCRMLSRERVPYAKLLLEVAAVALQRLHLAPTEIHREKQRNLLILRC